MSLLGVIKEHHFGQHTISSLYFPLAKAPLCLLLISTCLNEDHMQT